jgi:hypothetical protein
MSYETIRLTAASLRDSQTTRKAAARPPTEHHQHVWQGIEMQIIYQLDAYSFCDGYAHLEVQTFGRTSLPITETGYRSHFVPRSEVEDCGGPVSYVTAWLNHAAKSPAWKAAEADARQGRLF